MSERVRPQRRLLPKRLMALSADKRLQGGTLSVHSLYVVPQRGRIRECRPANCALFRAVSTVDPLVDPQVPSIRKRLGAATKCAAMGPFVRLSVLVQSP